MVIADSYKVTVTTAAPTTELVLKADVKICDNVEIFDNSRTCDVETLSISTSTTHMNVLQQLHCRKHKVYGDGNCLYYAVAHQAGYIEHSSHGNIFVGKQLRMLALITMQKYPGVRTEAGLSQHQWEQKKLCIPQPSKWGLGR